MIDFDKLKAPFPPDQVSWRIGRKSKDGKKALPLAYLDARDVMDRLDDVCGPAGWQCKYSHANGKTVCDIGIRCGQGQIGLRTGTDYSAEWIWKADGAGDSDIEAEKGALSDAFKRAAVRWGIGRYLYDIKAPYVSIDEYGHFPDHEMMRLMALLPNAHKDTPKVTGLSGQSHAPAKFWSEANLSLKRKMPKDPKDPPEVWLYDQVMQAINKAPTRIDLSRLQNDNLEWIPTHVDHDAIVEAFQIRASQFDQLNGAR